MAAYRSLVGTVARTDAEHPERWALAVLRDAYRARGDRTTFPAYLTELRVRHRRQPTFLKTLDTAGF